MYCKHGEDITIPSDQRGPEWVIWKWTKWNPLKPMKIERACYNDLGPTWTERNEFRFTDTL